jgi:hypothetical protein
MKAKSLPYLMTVLLMLPLFAFAGSKNSSNLNLEQLVKVAGTQLSPGQYKVVWEGTGSDVQVSFLQGKNTVATAPAKLASQPTYPSGAIETATTADHTTELRAIDLKNVSIRFEDSTGTAGN